MLKVSFLIWRIIHYVCVNKTFGDIDAVKMRCMDHVLVNSDFVTISQNDRNCSLEKHISERWKQVTGLIFHMRTTVNGKEQRFNGVRFIVFNEIDVELFNFLISFCDPYTFITNSILIPILKDMDLFLSNWTTEWYFRHTKTVCKYSQMLFLSWNVWN